MANIMDKIKQREPKPVKAKAKPRKKRVKKDKADG
jgi:hypothetical protein